MEYKGKILIIVENLPVPFDTRVWQEATTLVANGYVVSVICPKGKGYTAEREELRGVQIFRHDLPVEGNGAFGYLREYGKALREELRLARLISHEIGFDVIHGCNPPDNIFLVARAFRKHGVGYVFDHHDLCPELFEAKFGTTGMLKRLMYRSQLFMERQTYRHCDFAFVTNESYRQIAIERGGMKPEDVVILRSGPDLGRLRIQPPDETIKRGKKYMVGYLGVIGQQEGLDHLLEAARIVKRSRNDVFWGIVGGGPHLEALKKQCREMGLEDCVTFTGRVPDDQMLAWLNTADVCVNPDTYNAMNDKSTMNKVLEYMALGKPIVQFDLTEGRFSAREASLYAERNNAADMACKITQLLDDPTLREKMSRFGRERIVGELSWEHTSKALLEGYARYFTRRSNRR